MNTGSVLETLKELRRWEQTTSTIESRIKELRTLKMSVREKIRSLEHTLSVLNEDVAIDIDSESSGTGV